MICLCFLLLVGCAGNQRGSMPQRSNPATTNVNNEPAFGAYTLEKLQKGLRIYIRVKDEALTNSGDGRVFSPFNRVSYRFLDSFDATVPLFADTVAYQDILLIDGTNPVVAFSIGRDMPRPGVLELKFHNTASGVKTILEIPLRLTGNIFSENHQFYASESSHPAFDNYVTINDTFSIRSYVTAPGELTVSYYSYHFRPALPPMAVEAMPPEQGFKVDSVFKVYAGQPIAMSKPGLYLFQADTLQEQGKAVRVGDLKYPKPIWAETLIDPLIYITTTDERRRLVTADNPKRELDRFWIYLAGNKDFARNMIRSYYARVTQANSLFTTYKEGWKTDKGMIYIIFGRPSSIRRDSGREVWSYNRQADVPPVSFAFASRPNLFSPANYELLRDANYDQIWFEMVERWRKGTQLN